MFVCARKFCLSIFKSKSQKKHIVICLPDAWFIIVHVEEGGIWDHVWCTAVGLNTTKKKHTITDIDSCALALHVLAIISDPETDFHRLMINSLGTNLLLGCDCVFCIAGCHICVLVLVAVLLNERHV
jgi:hypothetical protein